MNCSFGFSTTTSEGTTKLYLHFNEICFKVTMHNGAENVPLLLSLVNMNRHGISRNNIKEKLFYNKSEDTTTVTPSHEYSFLLWNLVRQSSFMEKELCWLHCRFVQPKADKLQNLLKQSELRNIDEKTRELLEKVTCRCKSCQRHVPAPQKFKFVLREAKKFKPRCFIKYFIYQQ